MMYGGHGNAKGNIVIFTCAQNRYDETLSM